MSASKTDSGGTGPIPSMLDLVRLSRRPLFPPGGKDLYRQIALLTDMGEDEEVLVAACGPGITLEYFVREFGVHGSGVDEDPVVIEKAEERTREGELQERVHFQRGELDDLPYRDDVFDVVVGEVGLTARADPEAAIRELARVTRPGGRMALVQLVWKAPVDSRRKAVLSRHLGARPVMLVELKRMLREAGFDRLHTEAWSDDETSFRPSAKKPFPDFAELFSVPEKLAILRRAWSRWGWRGVAAAIGREVEVHRLLTKERILGLDMIKGTKGEAPAEAAPDAAESEEAPEIAEDTETRDLPLFTRGEEP